MKKARGFYLFLLALAAVGVGVDLLRVNSLPAPKGIGKPMYVVASPDTRDALGLHYPRSMRGPALGGLLPGGAVYATPAEAAAVIETDGRKMKGWGVFLLDGDIEQDSWPGKPRRLRSARLVLREVLGR